MAKASTTAQEKPGWRELPIAAIITTPGSSEEYQTGDWRSNRPIFYPDRCIQCFFCWVYCPDNTILVENRKVVGIDYYHCKGCGICSEECPTKPDKAIEMVEESPA